MNADDLRKMSPEARGLAIKSEAGLAVEENGLENAENLSRVINNYIGDYFCILQEEDMSKPDNSALLAANLERYIDKELKLFKPLAKEDMKNAMPTGISESKPKNLYEISGAYRLAGANNVTRNLSTTMGLLWERLANISPYAINPEIEFDLKIKGIDLIIKNLNTNIIEYIQLKTQKNTLTGSQKTRSVIELSIHNSPVFCASFSLGAWTFRHPDIPRISGEDFWNRIGIDYDLIEAAVKMMIAELDDFYSALIADV